VLKAENSSGVSVQSECFSALTSSPTFSQQEGDSRHFAIDCANGSFRDLAGFIVDVPMLSACDKLSVSASKKSCIFLFLQDSEVAGQSKTLDLPGFVSVLCLFDERSDFVRIFLFLGV